ncbi:hypothetical protein ABMC89_02150 [Sulfitobacter sp. HNIBRBA3233]|uniref:hypothetical protein n=1 Tax=Sulfitobacter marinivivus TaxID=3158558 RepID=UPI0032DFF37A
MEAQTIAILLLTPFALAFVYAGVHEYLRYKSDGSASYGLVYDEETGTSHVTAVAEEDEAFDPDTYDPNDYNVQGGQKDAADDDDRSRDKD